MRKIGLSILIVVAVATIYYFTSGATQLSLQMKKHVDAQFSTLQNKGFAVVSKEISENKEHFIITVDKPEKISTFLNTKGIQIAPQELKYFKGLQLGVDVEYLANAYSAASFDVYLLALPTALSSASLSVDDKKVLEQVENMIEKKTFLLHVDVNKLGTGFKGHMKDIDEVIEDDGEKIKFTMESLQFSGDIENEKLASIKQTLKNMNIRSDDDAFDMQITNLISNYKVTGTSNYDYDTDYSIENVKFVAKDEFKLNINNFFMHSSSKVANGLTSITAETKIGKIHFGEGQKSNSLDTLVFNMKANNLDMNALSKIETIDSDNEKELLALFQQLLSHGIHFEISNFSVKQLELDNKKLDGFMLTSAFDIDKSLDLASLEKNPMAAINSMDANIELILSSQLFAVIAQQPQAIMAMMLFPPKDVKDKKVYKIELKNGKLRVNEKPIM